MDELKLKERLLLENQRHEQELAKIKGRNFLTEAERMQEKELKKRKLALKDRMYQMMSEFSRSL